MIRSQSQSRRPGAPASTEKATRKITGVAQLRLDLEAKRIAPGSYNDCYTIRAILVDAIKQCGKSRAAIAEEMTLLLGTTVTEIMLNGFTAESKKDCRWPAEFDRAFCEVTGDMRLIATRVEGAGMHLITDDELDVYELGKQYRILRDAEDAIALLHRRMEGRTI